MAIQYDSSGVRRLLKKGNITLKDGTVLLQPTKRKRVEGNKTTIDNHVFDSMSEALIYSEFKIDPDIEILEFQPKFVLLKPFKRKNKSYRGITYTADFKIKIKGVLWIVEVKSVGTLKANSKSYPIKRKLFLHKFPDLNFKEIIFDGKQRIEKDY